MLWSIHPSIDLFRIFHLYKNHTSGLIQWLIQDFPQERQLPTQLFRKICMKIWKNRVPKRVPRSATATSQQFSGNTKNFPSKEGRTLM